MKSSAPSVRRDPTTPAAWVSVGLVTACTFIAVTSEMLPVGVLTPMAEGLRISPGVAGSSLTITGLVTAVTAPIVPRLLGDADRRIVMAIAMVVLAAGNVLTAIAPGFAALVAARILLGLGMGAVWGMAAVTAARLVAPQHVALAISLAVSGVASASVLGVPLGTILGNAFGWRSAFAALAGLAIVLSVALIAFLPRLGRPEESASGSPVGSLWRPAVVGVLAAVALLVTAHFAAYTYVRPVLESESALSPNAIAGLLLLYGAFGLLGNFAGGALAARRPRITFALLGFGIALAVALLAAFGANALIAGLAIALWGVAYGGVSVGGQLWVGVAAPDRVEHATGLYVGVFTASIALGALLGGFLVEGLGIVPMLWIGAAVALASTGVVAASRRLAGSR